MLLTIFTTRTPATDLGYLLHKNPGRLHTVALNFGQAHVFYPEAGNDRCTAALLIEVDPVGLSRREEGDAFALQPYVNDRPYAASSFLSVALRKVFGTLFSGTCKQNQSWIDEAWPFEVTVAALPCRGGDDLLARLFTPLGYTLKYETELLDAEFPAWGDSPYRTVTFTRTCPLREFLDHLYVLMPVLDNDKHYWIGDDEVEKLLKAGTGWLQNHPEQELITRRYLGHRKSLVSAALARLAEASDSEPADEQTENALPREAALEKTINLNTRRMEWVTGLLKERGARSVVDLGCGEGKLLSYLLKEPAFEKITGMDVSARALAVAARRLKLDRLPDWQARKLELLQGALTYRDRRLKGYDAATLIEVIEHLDPGRLHALERVVFQETQPGLVVVTTPNAEYNALFPTLPAGQFRHSDHRFEWSRVELQAWATRIGRDYGYEVSFDGIGIEDETFGFPTQAAIFTKASLP